MAGITYMSFVWLGFRVTTTRPSFVCRLLPLCCRTAVYCLWHQLLPGATACSACECQLRSTRTLGPLCRSRASVQQRQLSARLCLLSVLWRRTALLDRVVHRQLPQQGCVPLASAQQLRPLRGRYCVLLCRRQRACQALRPSSLQQWRWLSQSSHHCGRARYVSALCVRARSWPLALLSEWHALLLLLLCRSASRL